MEEYWIGCDRACAYLVGSKESSHNKAPGIGKEDKRIMKRRILQGILVVVLLSIVGTACTGKDKELQAYFQNNRVTDREAWMQDAAAKPILLIGEHHGVADNYELFLDILRELPEESIQLVMEMPPSFAYLCTEYLITGDENLLLQALQNMEGTFGFTQENLQFWRQVKTFSEEGKRIDVIGIDQEFQLKNTGLALLTIDKDAFTPVLQRIDKAGADGTVALLQELDAIVKEYDAKPANTDKDAAVQDIMVSLAQLCQNPKGDKNRDLPLYQTFVRKVDPNRRVLGLFGGDHIVKASDSGSMVSQLLANAKYREQIAVMQLFYVNSSYMDASTGQSVLLESLSEDSVIVQDALQAKEAVVAYRLPEDELFSAPDLKGLALPALYDYALVIKDAKASTRIASVR